MTTMQLVPEDIHWQTGHTGGAAFLKRKGSKMLREMKECGRSLTIEDISDLESKLGFTLPQDYRDF